MSNDRLGELDRRIAALGSYFADAQKVHTERLAKQRAVNEALLAWAMEMDYAPPTIITALRDALK